MAEIESRPSDFIRDMIAEDVKSGKHGGKVCTRFPPEPNGYLHIGHAKSICLNFGIAQEFGGECHLRMDDTNPTTEETEYVDSIQADVRWLGFQWGQQRCSMPRTTSIGSTNRREADPPRPGLRVRPHRGADGGIPGHGDPGWEGQPLPHPHGRREPRSLSPHARGRVPGGRPRAPGPDRHGLAQHEDARSRRCTGSSTRTTTARAIAGASTRSTTSPTASRTRSRGSPLPLHHGVRERAGALRLGHRRGGDALGLAPDRVRPAEPELHRHQQAPAARVGAGEARERLGRPPAADNLRDAAPGIHARGHPRVLRAHRGRQEPLGGRCVAPGAHAPGGSRPPVPPAFWACSARSGWWWRASRGQTEEFAAPYWPERKGGPAPTAESGPPSRKVPFCRELLIERDDFRWIRLQTSIAWRPGARCVSGTPMWSPARASPATPRGRSPRSAARTTLPRAAARRPSARRWRGPCTG